MKLKRSIGKFTLIFLTINAILGTGIFFLPAIGAAYAGPASLVSWAIMGFIAILISMCFAELVSMYPRSGGIYEYVKRAFGVFWAFIVGWTAWIISNITIAMLVVGSLYYLFPSQGYVFYIIVSLLIIILFNYINYRGIDWSSKLLLLFGVVTVLSLLMIIFPGLPKINPANYSPFMLSAGPIFLAIYFIAETFFGWEATTFLAEEIKDARKVLPKTLVIGTAIIAVISILLVFVSLGIVNWVDFSREQAPLVFVASKIFGGEWSSAFAILVFIPLIGTAAGWIVSSPRLLYAMSRDGVITKTFSRIHPKFQTPHHAIIFQAVASSLVVLIGLGSYTILISLLIPLVIIVYSFVLLSVVKLSGSKVKRTFTSPFNDKLPLLIVAFNALLLFTWLETVPAAADILTLGILLIMMGMPLYLIIKLHTDERFVEKFFNELSFIWDKTFPVWYGKKEEELVISRLALKKSDAVLDFGCGSGITTTAVARKARKVVAVDLSQKQLDKAVSRVKKAKLPNVIFVKDDEPEFPKNSFDAVVCVGVLEYLGNPKKELGKIFRTLKPGGTFSFLSFGKSFGLPANDFLESKDKLRELFSGLGVYFNVKKEKKKFTEYYYVWGRKR